MADASLVEAVGPGFLRLLSRDTRERAQEYRRAFLTGQPFRHVLVDEFFENGFAERLLAVFPAFDPIRAKNEIYGGVWGKAVNTSIRDLGSDYRVLFDLIGSRPFLDLIGEISGIPDLLFDPAMFGGGTHENLHGQDLDPHVDFNYDELQQLHRRLNLIVYLNKGWQEEWGGALELHSNPRKPNENQIKTFNPIFNRAVLFETNERSWHGFPKIDLPPAERHQSRKSVSIYLYSKERPAEEIAPLHGTFYVQRPLPDWVQPGHVLTQEDCHYLRTTVDRRDRWIEVYQEMELTKSRQVAENAAFCRQVLAQVRAPLTGYILQEGRIEGLYPDGWAQRRLVLEVRPQQPVTRFRFRGWRLDSAASAEMTVRINGGEAACISVAGGLFEFELTSPEFSSAKTFRIEAECDRTFRTEPDDRDLAYVLIEIRAEHH